MILFPGELKLCGTMIGDLVRRSCLCWSSQGAACCTNFQASLFPWKCPSLGQGGGVWCKQGPPPLGGAVLLPVARRRSSIPPELHLRTPTLYGNLTEERLITPLCLWFPSEPRIHPACAQPSLILGPQMSFKTPSFKDSCRADP